jgi:uncharacterized oligopeptide transporter (OPT) family protein
VYSFTEVALSLAPVAVKMLKRTPSPRATRPSPVADDDDEDPAEQVPLLWWTGGLCASSIFSVLVLTTFFKMSLMQAIFALCLGFLLSFIGIQSTAQTDVNPIGTISKVRSFDREHTTKLTRAQATQVVFGALTRGVPQTAALTVNLAAGAVAAGAAGQSTDMLNDLRTGYLLRASARAQFLAQLVGSAASVGTSVALFVLFARAAPCILTGASPCAYGVPSVGKCPSAKG